ncbi:MAG: methyltransferase [Gammaproteobacteria bacterium]|nr:methyltransferase [Gammaproteobacteria bacterium]
MTDWRQVLVAPKGTHHLLAGRPLYERRFNEVLKFHEPGLAPVRMAGEAWHIDVQGKPAYTRRFVRTFGFYQDRAAVEASAGWHHISADGTELYAKRYAWCGNFQDGRCPIRDLSGRYQHVDLQGAPVYAQLWNYAGDYRDGIAVVQAADGRATHIDERGAFVHGSWFLDLDVFHKGFARARDERGWMHVGRLGRPAYKRRFAMVEPFYNGQARVQRFDGGLEVIDERGELVRELRPTQRSEFHALLADLVGFWQSEAIAAAVEFGVFEALPATADELARSARLPPASAVRLLRALGELELVVQHEDGRWEATRRGQYLRADDPLTLRDAAIEHARYFARAWADLPRALQNGQGPRDDVFAQIASDPQRVARIQRMLRSYAREDYRQLAEALDTRNISHLIDAGAGVGVVAEALLEANPSLRVTLIERPEVVTGVRIAEKLRSRLTLHPCDFLQPWNVRGDAVLLARVLHDWPDERAAVILGNARSALRAGGKLFIVELLRCELGFGGSLCDLDLLVSTGGAERSLNEIEALLVRTGFALLETRELRAVPSLIIAQAR